MRNKKDRPNAGPILVENMCFIFQTVTLEEVPYVEGRHPVFQSDGYRRNGTISKATTLSILIMGLIAGPAVSL